MIWVKQKMLLLLPCHVGGWNIKKWLVQHTEWLCAGSGAVSHDNRRGWFVCVGACHCCGMWTWGCMRGFTCGAYPIVIPLRQVNPHNVLAQASLCGGVNAQYGPVSRGAERSKGPCGCATGNVMGLAGDIWKCCHLTQGDINYGTYKQHIQYSQW